MQIPFHPMIVHFPIAITFILPFLILAFGFLIKGNKMNPKAWLIIVALQMVTTATGYIALESGEIEEDRVEKVVEHKLIHEHEEAAEVFVGFTVLALVVGIAAFFIRIDYKFYLHLAIFAVTLVSCYLAFRTGKLGGELVYKHGAASAYAQGNGIEKLLPTQGRNTSESSVPIDENESLKADEHDYGNSDESLDNEEYKQED